MGGTEIGFVNEAFTSNWIAPLGPNVDGFEQDLMKFTGSKAAAALSSGTAALHLALILSNVTAGDEVIVSSFTFSASVNPIVYQGATPIFIDSEEDTWNMSPILLEEAIKDRLSKGKKLKAIIVVHLYGMPAKMNEIMAISKLYNIPVIEDAAEALGSTYNGKAVGTFGKFGILSFNGNKIITTSGGGALISNNDDDVKKARFLATQARDNAPHYQHSTIGYNYRMSNVIAGIGRGQIQVLKERIEKKTEINQFYKKAFENTGILQLLHEPNPVFKSNFWLTTALLNHHKPEELRQYLETFNIETRPLWKPMHMQPIFSACPAYINGVSENLFERGICLPSGTAMTQDDLQTIIEKIKSL